MRLSKDEKARWTIDKTRRTVESLVKSRSTQLRIAMFFGNFKKFLHSNRMFNEIEKIQKLEDKKKRFFGFFSVFFSPIRSLKRSKVSFEFFSLDNFLDNPVESAYSKRASVLSRPSPRWVHKSLFERGNSTEEKAQVKRRASLSSEKFDLFV